MEAGAIIKQSWRLMWRNPGQILRIFTWVILLTLVVILGLPILMGVNLYYMQPGANSAPGAGLVLTIIAFVLLAFFTQTAAAVNCHRHQIDGETFGWMPRVYVKPTLKYLAVGFLLALSGVIALSLMAGLGGGFIGGLISLSFGPGSGMNYVMALPLLLGILLAMLLGMIWLRLMLHLPAVAGQRKGLDIWAATRGQKWTFFLLVLLDGFLLLAPSLLFALVIPLFFGGVMNIGMFMLISGIVQAIMSLLVMIFLISQLSAMFIRYIGEAGLQRDDVSVFE